MAKKRPKVFIDVDSSEDSDGFHVEHNSQSVSQSDGINQSDYACSGDLESIQAAAYNNKWKTKN